VLDTVLDAVNTAGRRNVVGQLDLFGMDESEGGAGAETLTLPEVEEFSAAERMSMEREMTGLYLSGHPMDGYRDTARRLGATPIGSLLADFSGENGPERFADGQSITVAGIIGSYKTRTTKNNSMMAYVNLEDDSGFMELILFQRALDAGRQYLKENEAVVVRGRISVRDEKEPQIMVDSIRPLADPAGRQAPEAPEAPAEKKLWLRLESGDKKALRKIELLLEMFPGSDPMVLYFSDSGKRMGAQCLLHPALLRELKEMLGENNVVVK
jgi:DNA polymerase-3 subunit alpha